MNTVRKRLCLLTLLHQAHILSNSLVGKQHKLFDKLVSILRTLEETTSWLSLLVNIEMQFLRIKLHRTILESFLTKFLSQTIEHNKFIGIFSLIATLAWSWSRFACTINNTIILEQLLHLFVGISAITLYHTMHNTISLYLSLIIKVKDNAISQFFLIRTKRAHKVTKVFWKHRNCTINKINTCCTFLCLTVNNITFLHIVANISNMNTHLIESLV